MNSTQKFTLFSIALGAILFTYLVVRGIFVEPILDELTTLFCYVEYASFWGEGIFVDANNHLLNSFLASSCYSVFGEHFFAIRLPNILSFLVFFYAVVKLSKLLNSTYLKYVFLISMTCIPYVLDYFAYCRGYGMSIAFLMLSIYLFIQNNKTFHWSKLALLSLILLLAIYANLNLLITAILIFAFILFKEVVAIRKSKNMRHLLIVLLVVVLFFIALLPALSYASKLREMGALYYGNKDGLWLTTGLSLSKNVLFSGTTVILYTLMIIFLFLFLHACVLFVRKSWLTSESVAFSYLLFGNLASIVAMRWLLDVNFPEDRVGMHLIFLVVGAVIFSLQHYKMAWISCIFLLFPILGWKHFNVHTSVFSPDDRMEKADFEFFMSKISTNESSAIYFTQLCSYTYHVRKSNPTDFVVPSVLTDFSEEILLDKRHAKEEVIPNYKLIHYNPLTSLAIFQQKEKLNWHLVESQQLEAPIQTKAMYQDLIDTAFWKKPTSARLKISIECEISVSQLQRESIVLIINQVNNKEESRYENFNLNWAAGKNKTFKFKKIIDCHPDSIAELSVYLFNSKELEYSLLSKKVTLFSAQ